MFILDLIKADKYNKEADKINIKALNRLGEAERLQMEQEQRTMQSLQKLANRKKGIVSTSIKDFISVYEKIMKVNFVESDGINQTKELSIISPDAINEMKLLVSVSGYSLTSSQTVSTFVVGTLSGGIIGGISRIIEKESELDAAAAKARRRVAEVAASQCETSALAMDYIYQRAERMSKLLAQLNLLFRKCIENTSIIIEKNGRSRINYSKQEKEYIKTCMTFADTIKQVLDVPLLDQNGEITEIFVEAINIGEDYLQKVNLIIG